MKSALKKCLNKLPENQRALVSEAYSDKIKINEIAKREGRSRCRFIKSAPGKNGPTDCVQNTLQAEGGRHEIFGA